MEGGAGATCLWAAADGARAGIVSPGLAGFPQETGPIAPSEILADLAALEDEFDDVTLDLPERTISAYRAD